MIRFELKKIFQSKVNLIAMAVGLVLMMVVFFFQNFGGDEIYNEKTDSYMKDQAAVAYSREKALEQGTILTDEMIERYILELQEYPGDPDSDEAYVDVIRKNGALYYYLLYCYQDLGEADFSFNHLTNLDLTAGTDFYQRRMDKITSYLNYSFSYGDYTETEKEFWIKKAESVETPFVWGSKAAQNRIFDMVGVGFYLLAVVVVCISPMFSREGENGAVQLLLSTKYGKTRLIKAKIAASMIFAVGYIGSLMAFMVLLEGLVLGFYEINLPIQLWGNAIPYNWTIGQTCLVEVILIFLMALSLVSIILLLSAFTKNSIGSMAIVLLLIILPAFIPYDKYSNLFNHLLDLTYIRFADLSTLLQRFTDYQFGSLVLDQITMAAIVWIGITLGLLIPLRKIFVARCVH